MAFAQPKSNHPTKQEVRYWLTRRRFSKLPPPEPQELRRQLGWGLIVSSDDMAR